MIIRQPKRRWLLLNNSRSGTFRIPSMFFTLSFVWKISKTEKNFLRSNNIANAPLEILSNWKKNWPMLLLRIIHNTNLLFFSRCSVSPVHYYKKSRKKNFIIAIFLNKHLLFYVSSRPNASFRSYSHFLEFGSVSPLHINGRILRIFYCIAPNHYDVFLILFIPPFMYSHEPSLF